MPNAVPVKTILRKMLRAKTSEIPRLVIQGKAALRMRELAALTGIDEPVLVNAALDAMYAALAGKPGPRQVKDARLRAWLNRPEDQP